MNQALISIPLQSVSRFCRICTASNGVDYPIYELSHTNEGTTKLHAILVKLFPTVFNESQVLSDKLMNWPSKICQDCKGKVMESYRLYELCQKSIHQLTILAANQQTQEEKDDPLAQIKMEFVECEEPTAEPKEEYDADDPLSKRRGVSPTEDVLNIAEKNCSSTANELHLKPSMSTVQGMDHNYSASTRIPVPVRQLPTLPTVPTSTDPGFQLPTLPYRPLPVAKTPIIYKIPERLSIHIPKSSAPPSLPYRPPKPIPAPIVRPVASDTTPAPTSHTSTPAHIIYRIPERLSNQISKSSALPSLPYRPPKTIPVPVDRPVASVTTPASTSHASTPAHIPTSNPPVQSHEERIENYMQTLTKITKNLQGTVKHIFKTVCPTDGSVTQEFELEKVSNKEQLESLNSKLQNDSTFMAKTLSHIIHVIYTVSNVDARLSAILNLLFDRQFLRQCSWTGRGFPNPKICLSEYEYILSLCKFAGGNNFMELTDDYLKSFFKRKLYHATDTQNAPNTVAKKRPCPD